MDHTILQGAYDLHVHTSPDVVQRKCTDLELARRFQAAGMAGGIIKCHYGDTAARAALLREQFPGLNIAGGVVLNRSAGGINPQAVERSAQMGGRIVWFPTLEAYSYQNFHHGAEPGFDLSPFIYILDENGELIPQALEVLDMAAKYHLIVATGHVGAQEGMKVVREATKRGCRTLLTHADNPADRYTTEQQVQAVKLGAMVEHCFFTTYYGRTPIEKIAEEIRAVGCENVVLSTDFGQVGSPYSDEGISLYAQQLREQGFTDDQLRRMLRDAPESLLV